MGGGAILGGEGGCLAGEMGLAWAAKFNEFLINGGGEMMLFGRFCNNFNI